MSFNVTIESTYCESLTTDDSCLLTLSTLTKCCELDVINETDDTDYILLLIYLFTMFSFISESIGIILAAIIYYFAHDKTSPWKYAGYVTCIFITISVVLDWFTVGIIDQNNIVDNFDNLVSYQCYTRDAERDVAELASNLEQILVLGVIEGLMDLIDLFFDISSLASRYKDNEKGHYLMIIHLVLYVLDLILSIINFALFAQPAFDQYNALSSNDQCYQSINIAMDIANTTNISDMDPESTIEPDDSSEGTSQQMPDWFGWVIAGIVVFVFVVAWLVYRYWWKVKETDAALTTTRADIDEAIREIEAGFGHDLRQNDVAFNPMATGMHV